MPAVSVIIPSYNTGRHVAECLASVECQTLRDIEVICVDDASSDDSLAVIRGFAEADGRFKVLALAENGGVSAARNRALDVATGEFVMFVDADDWLPADSTVERLYRAAVDNGASIAGGGMCVFDDKKGRKRTDYRGAGHLSLYSFKDEGFVDYRDWQGDLGFQRFIYKRSLLDDNELRFPPIVRYEDPVFFVKAMLAAGRFYAVPEPTYCYRVNEKPAEISKRAIDDAVDAHIDLLIIAQQNDLQLLRGWLIESLEWYLAQNVYNSTTYKLGDAIAAPYRRVVQFVSSRLSGR